MGSPLGPLLANVFLCSVEEKLLRENSIPKIYRRYVDDTLAVLDSILSAQSFLKKLNACHPGFNL